MIKTSFVRPFCFGYLSFAVLVLFPHICVAIDSQLSREEQTATWVGQNYRAALELLLPLRNYSRAEEGDWKEVDWRMRVRICPPWKPEMRLEVSHHWSGRIIAWLDFFEGRSLSQWLEYLHTRYPESSLRDLVQRTSLKTIKIDSDGYPDLKLLAKELNQLCVPGVPSTGLSLDRVGYEVEITAPLSDNSVCLSFNDLDDQPLLSWMTKLRSLFNRAEELR